MRKGGVAIPWLKPIQPPKLIDIRPIIVTHSELFSLTPLSANLPFLSHSFSGIYPVSIN